VNGYERRKLRSRESILRSALELFRASGIRKVSVAQIAKRSGVDPVTVYNNFGSKEELAREAIGELIRSHWVVARAAIEGSGSFSERLRRLIEAKREEAAGSSSELFADAMRDDPAIARMIKDNYANEVLPVIDAFIKKGQAEGAVRADISASTLRAYIELLLEASRSHPGLASSERGLSALTEEMWALFLYGICGSPPAAKSPAPKAKKKTAR